MTGRRELIEATVSDLVKDLLHYDRKDDGELPRGAVEAAIQAGEITAGEISNLFGRELGAALGEVATRQYIPSGVVTQLVDKPGVSVLHNLGRTTWVEATPDGNLILGAPVSEWTILQDSGAVEEPKQDGS